MNIEETIARTNKIDLDRELGTVLMAHGSVLMAKNRRFAPADESRHDQGYIGGVHYPPFERQYDARIEGPDNWRARVQTASARYREGN